MSRNLFALIFFFAWLINGVAHAQSPHRSNYSLLWRISGNNLKRSSYLFGTMHVRDNKAFDFSDSVLLKIEACEAFAMEVHPDSLSKEVLLMLMGRETLDNQFSQNLPADDYRELDSLMQARTGVRLSKFKTPAEANFFLMEQLGSKDKDTFLDSWLYNVARNQNKVILGLEDLRDQQALLEGKVKEQMTELRTSLVQNYDELKIKYQSLQKLYQEGDIDALRTLMLQTSTPEQYAAFITSRNGKMASNLIKEIHQHSTFAAVGAAHLPGDEGLISLLRKEGYQVTRVTPVFTGLAAKYQTSKVMHKWMTYTSGDAGYSVDMPKPPVPLKIKALPMDMQTSLDIGTLTAFMATHVVLAANMRNQPAARLFELMTKGFSNSGPVKNQKIIKVAGYDAMEFESGNEGHYFRMRVILRDPVIYFMAAGSTEESARGEDANRFFNSFEAKPLSLVSTDRQLYKHDIGAFSVSVSGKVTEQRITQPIEGSSQPYKLNIFYTTDNKSGEAFIFRYNDFPAGLVSINDSTYLHESVDLAVSGMKGTHLKKTDTTYEGYPSLKFDFEVPEQKLLVKGFNVLRGNRYYVLFTVRSSALSSQDTQAFLNSFSFLPYQQTTTKEINFDDGISLKIPQQFEQDSAVNYGSEFKRYSFIDTNSGIPFIIQVEKISPYTQANSVAGYFENIKTNLLDEGDSTMHEQSLNDKPGHEYLIKSNKINAIKYIKFLVADEKLISLWSYLPADYQQTKLIKEMYESLNLKPATSWSLTSNKTDLLLHDIGSPDSTIQTNAREAIYTHEFAVNDLPKLYTVLKMDDQSLGSTMSKSSLFQVLKKVQDDTTSPFIQEIYPTLPDTTSLRDLALGVLTSMHTESDTKVMLNLMQQDDPRPIEGYGFLYEFYDSLELFNSAIMEMVDMEPRFKDSYMLYHLVKMALDSNALHQEVKETVIRQVTALGTRLVNEPVVSITDNRYADQHARRLNLASLLTSVPFNQEVKEIIMKLHSQHDIEIMLITAIYLLKNNVSVSAKDLDAISENALYRLQLYEGLKELHHEKRMSKKYTTASMLAESDLFIYLSYEDDLPQKLALIAEKEVVYDGRKQRVFIYKYQYEGSDDWYTAMSGPYLSKAKSGFQRGDLTTSFYELYTGDEALMENVKVYIEEQGGSLISK